MNRLNDYIWDKIATGTRKHITTEYRIDVNRFCGDVKQVMTPIANEFTNFTAQTTADAIADTITR